MSNNDGVKLFSKSWSPASFVEPPDIGTVTIERLPDWVRDGDWVIKRGEKHFLRSVHETEPRWKHWLRRLDWL